MPGPSGPTIDDYRLFSAEKKCLGHVIRVFLPPKTHVLKVQNLADLNMDRFPSVTGPAPPHQTARRVGNPVQVTSLGIRRGAEGKRGARTRPATCAERAICKLSLHFTRLVSPRRASRFSAVSRPARAAGQPDLAASAVVEWCCWAGLSVCGVASSTASSTASSRTSDIAREMSTRGGR